MKTSENRTIVGKVFNSLVIAIGAIVILYLLAGMFHEGMVRVQGNRNQGSATIVARSRGTITIRYQVKGKTYEKVIPRGILRFEFPSTGEVREILVSKADPDDTVVNPPIGGWIFWSTDLILMILLLTFSLIYFRSNFLSKK